MKFNKRYDYFYKQMTANLPLDNIYRNVFERWWKKLGRIVDSDKEMIK